MSKAENTFRQVDAWLIDHLEEFDPFDWHDTSSANARRKSFSELALYADSAEAAGKPVDERITDHLERLGNDARIGDLLRRDSRDIGLFGPLLQLLERRGTLDAALRDQVFSQMTSGAMFAVERVPFRVLEVAQLLHVFGIDGFQDITRYAVRSGCLRFPPNLFASVEMDAYAVTHSVFYLMDFGRGPIVEEPVDWEAVRTVLRTGLLVWAGRGNLDVALECAIALRLLEDERSGLEHWVLDMAAAQIDRDGVITSPHPEPGGRSDVYTPRTRFWLGHYHPTMIAGYLGRVMSDDTGPDKAESLRIAALSGAFAELSKYNLAKGAEMLARLRDRLGVGPFEREIEGALAFVARQRRSDGGFGILVDEQVLMENESEAQSPAWDAYKRKTSEACATLLNGWSPQSR